MRPFFLSLAALVLAGCATSRPTADGPLMQARAMAVDPTGRLWIADAGRAAVLSVPLDAEALTYALDDPAAVRFYGGPGDGATAFLEPVAVDPTNGLAWWVADAAAGLLHRVSFEGRLLETLRVGVDARASQRGGRSGGRADAPDEPAPTGAPLAVAAAASGEVYAIDAARQAVLRWERTRGPARVIAAPETGAVRRPVALALLPDGDLLVADAGGAGRVLRFDPFGTLRGTFAEASAVALSVAGGRVLLTQPGGVLVFDLDGARLGALSPAPGTPRLVGAVEAGGAAFGLTARGLVRIEGGAAVVPAR